MRGVVSEGGKDLSSDFAGHLRLARDAYAANELTACRAHLEQAGLTGQNALELVRWQARLAWRESDWKTLSEATESYLRVRPSDREMAQLHARALSNSRQWFAATGAWQRVTQLRPDWPESWYQLARIQLRADMPYAAARSAERLLHIAQGDAILLCARLALERGQMADAAEAFRRLAAGDPALAEKELRARERDGDFRAVALAAIGLAHSTDSESYKTMLNVISRDLVSKAVAGERRGDAVKAHLDYAVLAQIDGGDVMAQSGMKRTLQSLHETARQQIAAGDRQRARKTYLGLLHCRPGDARALAAIGQILMADQDWRRAAEAWDALLGMSPADSKALVQRARALDRAQEFAAALDAWNRVLAADGDNAEAHLALTKLPSSIVKAGRKAVEEHRYREAAAIFSAVPAGCPEHADVLRRLDQVFRYLHKDMRAAYKERRFEWVVAYGVAAGPIAPDNDDIQRLLAQAAMRTRDYEIAAGAWLRLIALVPAMRPSATLQLARCHQRLGRPQDGRAVLADLLRDEPDNAEAQVLLLELQAAAGGTESGAVPAADGDAAEPEGPEQQA